MNTFIQKFQDQFIDGEDITINEDTLFRSIESYDSLTGMAIIMMIEDDYGVKIEENVYKTLDTPKAIFNFINA